MVSPGGRAYALTRRDDTVLLVILFGCTPVPPPRYKASAQTASRPMLSDREQRGRASVPWWFPKGAPSNNGALGRLRPPWGVPNSRFPLL